MPRTPIEIPPTVEYLSILDEDDELDVDLEPDLDDDLLLRMHRAMLLARRFDEHRLKWQRSGRIGTFAPVEGQEASEIGAIAAISEDDWMVPSFREAAVMMWRGTPMSGLIVYDAGYNEGGRVPDGQQDLPIAIPVASQIPHAAGLGYGIKYRGGDQVVLVFFGDGATSEGDFHEAMNFAGTFELPVVFCCQNNQWAISVPREEQTASKSLAQKALAYGFPGIQVDGNDVLAVHTAVSEAADRARSGEGPTLVELDTYRLNVHTTADDPTKYRSEEEEELWKQRDPIPRFQRYLKAKDLIDDAAIEGLEDEIEDEIAEAWEEAEARRRELDSDPAHMVEHVYAEMPKNVSEQRERFVAERTEAGHE